MQATVNFGFLPKHDERLATLGAQAERYFRADPSTAIVRLRRFAELLAKVIAAHRALHLDERETFEDTLRRLSSSGSSPRKQTICSIRKLGNAAVHDAKGGHSDALASLKFARQLGAGSSELMVVSRISVRGNSAS
jgi:type I restriction enzyme, R subunit